MATTEEDIADLTLHHMGRTGLRPFLVVIGAMDGVTFDDFHGYINMYQWSGLFVEPIPEQFRRLRQTYAKLSYRADNKYENCAIAHHDGTIQMLTINQDAIDQGKVHPAFGGMSAIYPPRNGLASPGDAETVATYGELIEVNCLTLPTLFERHAIENVDLLCMDAEGWDYEILQQFDFATYRPKLIRCEYINLTPEDQAAIAKLLVDHGYVIRTHGQNIDAVAAEYWETLPARPTVSAAASRRRGGITLVTAVFDLSSGEPDVRLRATFGRYLDSVKRLLRVEWPMVIFAQPELEEMIWRFRVPSNTHLVSKSLADLRAFPFFERVQELGTAGRPPLYHPFVLSKQFFLNDAAIFNPFDTDYFLWLDGDIAAASGDPTLQLTEGCERSLSAILSDQRMLYVSRPMTAQTEVRGFSRAVMAEFAGEVPEQLVCGRVFGGTRPVVNAINGIYYSLLGQTLEAGCMGTEEPLLTIIACTHRHLCNLQILRPDRGLRHFLARLQQGARDRADRHA